MAANNSIRELYKYIRDNSSAKGVDVSSQLLNPTQYAGPWAQIAGALADEVWQATVEKGVLDLL